MRSSKRPPAARRQEDGAASALPVDPLAHALEQRVMLDAALIATVVEGADAAQPAPEAAPEPAETHESGLAPDLVAALTTEAPTARTEVVFIDGGVPGYQALVDGAAGEGREVVVLDPARDGLQQIAATLEGREGVDAIHILSHGTPAEQRIGTAVLNADTVDTHAATLARIGGSLTETGDILLYGCQVGKGEAGQILVDAIGRLTGADVAASDDATGAAAQAGDWDLERQSGEIEAAAVDVGDYEGLLVFAVESTDFAAADGSYIATLASGYTTPATLTASNVLGSGWDVVARSNDSTATFYLRGYNTSGWGDGDDKAFRLGGYDSTIDFLSNGGSFTFDLSTFRVRGSIATDMYVQALDVNGNLTGNAVTTTLGSTGVYISATSTAGNADFNDIYGFRVSFASPGNISPLFDNISVTDIRAPAPPNAAPTITVPSVPTDVHEDSTSVDIGDFVIADTDGHSQTVTITAVGGTATLGTTTGLTGLTGNGSGSISFSGSIADANTALASLTFTPTANHTGAASVTVATDDGNSGTDSETLNFTVNAGPTVSSIVRTSGASALTNADSVQFDVTFSGTVTGVDATDFAVTGTTATVANVEAVSGTLYRVTVSGGDLASYTGTVGLTVVDDDSIALASGALLGGVGTSGAGDGAYSAGQTYSLDNTPPTITAVTVPVATMKVGDVVTATITVASDADAYTLVSGTIGGFALNTLTKTNATTYTAQFTVTEAGTDVAAGADIPVSLVLRDAAGNENTAYTTAVSQGGDAINANSPTDIAPNTLQIRDLNTGANVTVGTLSATDATSGDTFTYALVAGTGDTNNASFNINGDALRTTGTLTAATYTIRVRVTDSAGNTYDEALTVTVTDSTPTLAGTAGASAWAEADTSAVGAWAGSTVWLFSGASVTSYESGFDGAKLTVSLGAYGTGDQISMAPTGTVGGEAMVFTSGTGAITIGGVQVATLSGGSAAPMVLTFTAAATQAHVNGLFNLVTFSIYANDNPTNLGAAPTRAVSAVFQDQNAGMTSAALTGTLTITGFNDAEGFTGTVAGNTFTEGGGAVALMPGGATVTQVDNTTFTGGTLQASLGAYATGDVLSVLAGGNITLDGSSVRHGGTEIGTIDGTDDGTGRALTIALNADATHARVQDLIAQLRFENTGQNPTNFGAATSRAATVTLNDGGAGAEAKPIALAGTITVAGTNQAPTANVGTGTTTENAVLNGTLPTPTDPDSQTFTYALVDAPAEGSVVVNANGTYSFDPGADFSDLAPGATRDVTFTYRTNDGTADSAAATMTLTVSGVNAAPTVTQDATHTLTGTTEDATSGGTAIAAILTGIGHADGDSGAASGVAITATTGNGTWQYSTNAGATWTAFPAVAAGSALLLGSTDQVRYVPDGNNGETATLTVRAWDQTSGSAGATVDTTTAGGTTAFSTNTAGASIVVSSANDAPSVTDTTPTLTSTDIETARSAVVSTFLGSSDVDASAVAGLAVTATTGAGTWAYSLDGTTWTTFPAVSVNAALLLRSTDHVRYTPDGTTIETASLTFRAWDQTSGTAGDTADATVNGTTTAFSTNTGTASLGVTDLNDAPTLTGANPTGTTVTEDDAPIAYTVSGFLAVTDGDGPASGIAITGSAGVGSWAYSIDGGTTWTAVGSVSGGAALLLRSTDQIRYVPDGQNGGTATLAYRAWDQSTGAAGDRADTSTNGGRTAFSSNSLEFQQPVTPVNDAPLIGTPGAIGTTDQNTTITTTVSTFLGSTEVDTGGLSGIAITAQTGNGTWQYSTDGTTWTAFPAVSGNGALLLGSTHQVRYIPDGVAAETPTLTYRAWDQSSGAAGDTTDVTTNGGTTAFSTAEGTSSLTVTLAVVAPAPPPAPPPEVPPEVPPASRV